jgi:nucleotide-binding universal stress UspA family protein
MLRRSVIMSVSCSPVTANVLAGYPDSIVVGVDGSDGDHAALALAMDEASSLSLPVVAVTVVPFECAETSGQRAAQSAVIAPFRTAYPEVSISAVITYHRSATDGLRATAAGAEMLILGGSARARSSGVDQESTASAILRCPPCTVLIPVADSRSFTRMSRQQTTACTRSTVRSSPARH